METNRALLASCLLPALAAWAGQAAAIEIYRCPERGTVAYTSERTGPSCRLVRLDVPEPNPAELARLKREKERRAAADEKAAEEARIERMIRVREMEAKAALLSARASVIEALGPPACEPDYYYPVPNYLAGPVPYTLPPNFGSYYGNYRPRPGDPYRIELPSTSLGFTLRNR
jgi:hypothetical protein